MSTIKLRISPGKAYVNGYKITKNIPTFLSVNKSTTTKEMTNDTLGASYGQYILLSSIVGLPDINSIPELQINNGTALSGSAVGTCRVRAVESYVDGSNTYYKLYIIDIAMNANKAFDVETISVGPNNQAWYGNILRENNRTILHNSNAKGLIFPLPRRRAKTVTNLSIYRQKKYTADLAPGATTATITADTGEVFVNGSKWIVCKANSAPETVTVSGINTSSASISGVAQNGGVSNEAVDVIAYTYKASANLAPKSLQNGTRSYSVSWTAGAQDVEVDMLEVDVVNIKSIKYNDINGDVITDKFILDNGARDAFYETSRLRLKNNTILDYLVIYVEFEYFEHGQGDYFAPNSYSGAGFQYSDIPNHIMDNGAVIDLKDCIDLRSTKGTTGNFSTGSAVVMAIPENGSIITFDAEYYLPRYDKLVVQEDGSFKYLEGTPAFLPEFPDTPTTAMELYRLRLNPATLNSNDLSFSMIENKRYTMRDIGKMEKRLDDVEEAVSLSLLEVDTRNIEVLDENGNTRTKTGFVADNFADQYFTDVSSSEYRASIDPQEQFARPKFNANNIGLVYDPTISTNTIMVGDNVYLNYTHEDYITQALASGTENVNPFMIMSFRGHIKLSPSSDDWKEVEYIGPNIIPGGTRLNTDAAMLWNEWEWNWAGSDLSGLDVGSSISQSNDVGDTAFTDVSQFRVRSGWLGTGRRTFRTTTTGVNRTTQTVVNRVVSSETITEVIGDRLVQWHSIPFMRSKLVYFRGEGLQPNTQMFAFFDGVDVSKWVRQESFTSFNSHKATEFGNTMVAATNHPNGNTALYTDGNGICSGSFFIPSTSDIRFLTGATEFKLTDITVLDDANAISVGSAIFTSTGILDTRQEDILSTRLLEVVGESSVATRRIVTSTTTQRIDPLAQSFTINESTGVFITKVSLFFKQKSSNHPVWIQLRPMVNGYPASDIIVPGSQKLLTSPQVSVSEDASVATEFIFDEPIYLKGYTDYCVVCLTDNTDYLLYTSKVGDFVLGSTEQKINRQPFMGSLFKSQNSVTWEAAQWQDMKFKLHRAKFTPTAGVAGFKNANVPNRLLTSDPILLFGKASARTNVKVTAPNHGLLVGDSVVISGVVDSAYASFINNGGTAHTITEVDVNSFAFNMSTISPVLNVEKITGGNAVSITPQYIYSTLWPNIEKISPVSTSVTFSHIGTSGKSYAGNESPYAHYSSEFLKLKSNNYYETPRVIAHPTKELSLTNNTSLRITGNMETSSNFVSPVIDVQRASVNLIENVIDNPVDVATVTTGTNNVVFDSTTSGQEKFKSETDPLVGSAASKHITKSVTLLATAQGLKVFIGANRPSVCGMDLYYKAIMGEKSYDTVNWVKADPDTIMPPDEDPTVFRDYVYTIGGDTGTLPDFTKFKLKIVFTSSNSSKIPTIRDLRAISLGD
tara:strand:+ start:18136 stop:22401 length:4266 start_codon:yes stop_codon:yes gene_type:complete